VEAIPHLQFGRLRASPFQNRRFQPDKTHQSRSTAAIKSAGSGQTRAGTLREVASPATILHRTPGARGQRCLASLGRERSSARDLSVSSSPRGRGVIRL
jgi:hypothetical protein